MTERRSDPGAAREPSPVVGFEVMGQDADRLRGFYEELLGWRFDTPTPLGYGAIQTGGGSLRVGVGQVRDGGRGWATFYSRVPQLERNRQKTGGAALHPEPERDPRHGQVGAHDVGQHEAEQPDDDQGAAAHARA